MQIEAGCAIHQKPEKYGNFSNFWGNIIQYFAQGNKRQQERGDQEVQGYTRCLFDDNT